MKCRGTLRTYHLEWGEAGVARARAHGGSCPHCHPAGVAHGEKEEEESAVSMRYNSIIATLDVGIQLGTIFLNVQWVTCRTSTA